jgi:hypothetical protein
MGCGRASIQQGCSRLFPILDKFATACKRSLRAQLVALPSSSSAEELGALYCQWWTNDKDEGILQLSSLEGQCVDMDVRARLEQSIFGPLFCGACVGSPSPLWRWQFLPAQRS